MRFVIMCGGSGTRLNHYSLPKPLNLIYGKPAIYYVLQDTIAHSSIKTFDFIVSPHLVRYEFESYVRHLFSNIKSDFNCVLGQNSDLKHDLDLRFHYLPYFTRGPVESAYLGTLDFDEDESVVFLDNDIIYPSLEVLKAYEGKSFLGYSIDNSGSEAFCFLKLNHGEVVEIQEKKRISNHFGCGVYGFSSVKEFRKHASALLNEIYPKELYMSILYSQILSNANNPNNNLNSGDNSNSNNNLNNTASNLGDNSNTSHGGNNNTNTNNSSDNTPNNEKIEGIFFPTINHIGSLPEVIKSLPILKDKQPKLRICVDLDNTLVTTPCRKIEEECVEEGKCVKGVKEGVCKEEKEKGDGCKNKRDIKDYTSVKPINATIQYIQEMKRQGHTIIIHTARKMKSCNHNEGAAIAMGAREVIDTLERFDIPYDELLFGKPIADIYIDDKAFNPYLNNFEAFGFFNHEEPLINFIPPNKNNKISMCVAGCGITCVKKEGLAKYLSGEIFYHQHLPEASIKNCFPSFISSISHNQYASLTTEYIKGIPYAYLFRSMLLNTHHIDLLWENLKLLHNAVSATNALIDTESVRNNYLKKLEERFSQREFYTFHVGEEKREIEEEINNIQKKCYDRLEKYCDGKRYQIVHYIHGDLWFSNIILTFDNHIKWLDMKGICWKTYTTSGDKLYDYAKLYQSFLGYDLVLNNWMIDETYQKQLLSYFEEKIKSENVDLQDVKDISYALIMGTLPFIESPSTRNRVWVWCTALLAN